MKSSEQTSDVYCAVCGEVMNPDESPVMVQQFNDGSMTSICVECLKHF